MIHIETIDLYARGVTFPKDRVGIVMAQSHLTLTPAEPFQCSPEKRQQQLNVIERTLEIARANAHGAQRTHFTVFPEFSIPGLDGIAAIEAAVQSPEWPARTVVIGGVDGLVRPDYLTLIRGPNTSVHAINDADHVAADQWVNCEVIWVKGANNVVERWIQPKIHPSGPENNAQLHRMFCGGCVYLFKGHYETGSSWYRFSTLICFDWIATVGDKKPWQWILESMDIEGSELGAKVPLTWMFVIQHNPKPNHETFLVELAGFFNPNLCDSADRTGTCIIFANNAGRGSPGAAHSFGCTSLVLPQTAPYTVPDCYPTYSKGGIAFRGNNLVRPHHDVLFRERGQCIHSFIQRNPTSIVLGAAGQAIPIENPSVFPIDPEVVDLRTPGIPVPAAVKWFNDALDGIQCLGTQYPADPLAFEIATRHQVDIGGVSPD